MENKKIVLLTGNGTSSRIFINYLLDKNINIDTIIVEAGVPIKIILQRRVAKLGFLTVMGQVLFKVFILPLLRIESKKRYTQLLKKNNLSPESRCKNRILEVESINHKKTINILKNISPDLILVNGTRIISKDVLTSINCTFVNTHVGITPKYRGVHGGYWALVNKDKDNCGVTIHIVDKGIDTGKIISQKAIYVTNRDNFITYPLLQQIEGLKLLTDVIDDFQNVGTIKSISPTIIESKLWTHPTIWQYCYNRLKNKVK